MIRMILIMGETARGKDTLVKMLEKRGLKSVCSCTTRPKRECETDGVEHIFISEKEADHLLADKDNIVAQTQIGKYRYFATMGQFKGADIYVIDPNGAVDLLSRYNINPTIVYVTCAKHTAIKRAVERGDDKNVVLERIEAEKEQFVNVKEKFKEYKFIQIDNDFEIDYLDDFANGLFEMQVDDWWKELSEKSKGTDLENIVKKLSELY